MESWNIYQFNIKSIYFPQAHNSSYLFLLKQKLNTYPYVIAILQAPFEYHPDCICSQSLFNL